MLVRLNMPSVWGLGMVVWCFLGGMGGLAYAAPPTKAPTNGPADAGSRVSPPAPGRAVQPAAPAGSRVPRFARIVKSALPADIWKRDMDCWRYLRLTRAPYCVELMTMGPGNWIFTYFGHNALRVVYRDPPFIRIRYDHPPPNNAVYNFGTFSGSEPMKLLWNYLQFRLQYQLSVSSYRRTEYVYRYLDRTLVARRLLLNPEETAQLVQFLEWHYQPQHRDYPYHHYTNNCSTKVRDALAKVLGPSFRERARVKKGHTYRSLVMKQMQANPLVMVLMDFGMGPPADRPLQWWHDMFLPHLFEEYVAMPFWKEERGAPLVGKPKLLYKRKQNPPFAWNPRAIIWTLALLWLLGALALANRPALRWYLRIVVGFFALLGTALFFMMVGTRFPEPPGNFNIAFYHPLHWVFWWYLGRKRWARMTERGRNVVRWYFLVHAAVACCYLMLKLFSAVPFQRNTHYIFFALFVFGVGALSFLRQLPWTVQSATSSPENPESIEAKEQAHE